MNRSSDSLSEFLGYGLTLGGRAVLQGRCLLEVVELPTKFVHVPSSLATGRAQFGMYASGLSPPPEGGGVDADAAGGGAGAD